MTVLSVNVGSEIRDHSRLIRAGERGRGEGCASASAGESGGGEAEDGDEESERGSGGEGWASAGAGEVGEGRLKMQYFEFLQHTELKLYNLAAELKAWSIRNMTELRTSRGLQRLREHHDQCARRYEETLLLTQVRHLTLPKLGWVVFIVWPSRQDCSVTV